MIQKKHESRVFVVMNQFSATARRSCSRSSRNFARDSLGQYKPSLSNYNDGIFPLGLSRNMSVSEAIDGLTEIEPADGSAAISFVTGIMLITASPIATTAGHHRITTTVIELCHSNGPF